MSTTERFPLTAEVVSAITSSLVLDEVLASVAKRTAEVLDLWECDIYEYRADRRRHGQPGPVGSAAPPGRRRVGGLQDTISRSGRPFAA